MSMIRVLTSAQVTLSHTFYVDETPTDASGSVAVTVKRLDGTTVSAGTAAHPGAAGVYTYAVPPQAAPDALTVDWSGTVAGAPVTARDHLEVVGGFLFGLAEARAMPPALDVAKYSTARLAAVRILVEQEFERICRRAFVPRFKRESVRIINSTVMPTEVDVRSIRAVSILGQPYTGWVWPSQNGPLREVHQATYDNELAVIEYEYGMEYPPEDVRYAAMRRLRDHLSSGTSAIPSRAVSFTVAEGGVYRLATPGEHRTGNPEVDAVLDAYRVDVWGFA